MSTTTVEPAPSPRVIEAMRTLILRVRIFPTAQRSGTRCSAMRIKPAWVETWKRLGGSTAPKALSAQLTGVSSARAAIEIGFGTGFLDPGSRTWLLREIGEQYGDPQRSVDAAISAGHLVLIETPRAAFWHGQPIEIDWDKEHSLWEFLWELCRQRRSLMLTQVDLGEQMSASALSTSKGRLVNHPNFPGDLGILVEATHGQGYGLNLPAAQIRVFLVEEHDIASEWLVRTSPFAELLARLHA